MIFLFALKLYFRALMNLSEVPQYIKKLKKKMLSWRSIFKLVIVLDSISRIISVILLKS
jgi:hypothetical protein